MKAYDYYTSALDVYELLDYVHLNSIPISYLKKKEIYTFYSTIQYRQILSQNDNIKYQYSIGWVGMILRFFCQIEKIVAFVFSAFLFLGLSSTIFNIEIYGDSIVHKDIIKKKLKYYKPPFLYYDDTSLLKKLSELNDDLNWYEVVRTGSNLRIYYLPRNKEVVKNDLSFDLIAQKDGVIASFDVSKGNKVVNIHDKVKKGDVLVSHILLDSQSMEKTSDVIGKVYAYTFREIEVEFNKKGYPKGVEAFLCLLKSRMMIDLDADEYIVKEISLHFSEDLDTIRMKNFYVIYEMISVIGD